MPLLECNAFLVNNRDRLAELFSKIDGSTIADVKELFRTTDPIIFGNVGG